MQLDAAAGPRHLPRAHMHPLDYSEHTRDLHLYPSSHSGAGPPLSQANLLPDDEMAHSGLDVLAEGSQYALHRFQQQQQPPPHHHPQPHHAMPGLINARMPLEHRHSFGGTSADGTLGQHTNPNGTSKPRSISGQDQSVRRRISRACDQCNQLRTKCDGKHPCAHCVEFGLTCEYARERKKRGKVSRKDLAAQQSVAADGSGGGGVGQASDKDASPKSGIGNESDETTNEIKVEMNPQQPHGIKRRRSSSNHGYAPPRPQLPPPSTSSVMSQHVTPGNDATLPSLERVSSLAGDQNVLERQHSVTSGIESQSHNIPRMGLPQPRLPSGSISDRGMPVAIGEYGTMDDYHRSVLHPGATVAGHNILHNGASAMPNPMIHSGTITGYGDHKFGAPSPNSQSGLPSSFRFGESPLSAGFLGHSPVGGSPGWLSLPSPSGGLYGHHQQMPANQSLRYPVLRPILPYIVAIMPVGLACDLLELYFTSTYSTFQQPQSPYVLGNVFRKRSFLRQNSPRVCSPALLASMLWVAAQTSESAFLTSPPSARGKVCQKLLELTIGLLKPLIHTPVHATPHYGANPVINGVELGGFGVALPGQAHEMERGLPGAVGALDNVATYIHLATIVSASEYKAASLRWWNAAWSLARELKMGRELPPNPEQPEIVPESADTRTDPHSESLSAIRTNQTSNTDATGAISEEEREERRRIWWLLYIVDRHSALCYNRPLALLDIECDGLLQPENDVVWQAGEFYGQRTSDANFYRRRGPCFECTSHSIFGYFLPLMTILGEIVDLNHARNHPRFGLRARSGPEWEEQAHEICQQLEAYGRSLSEFEAKNLPPPPGHSCTETNPADPVPPPPSVTTNGLEILHDHAHPDGASPSQHSTASNTKRMTESILQTRIVVAYATHLMHTLHILVNGKWDPISLLDDNDLWISSQSFISATGHAVSAAEAINEILDYDPDLSFMPFFFGIYLLQGSFLLLLIADKLQGEASPSVVKACEAIVHAHEACVVTLNTEYQRNFRKVMRSALAQVRGRMVEDFGEQQLRRREVLALYRWTGDGTGLAL